MDVNKERAFS